MKKHLKWIIPAVLVVAVIIAAVAYFGNRGEEQPVSGEVNGFATMVPTEAPTQAPTDEPAAQPTAEATAVPQTADEATATDLATEPSPADVLATVNGEAITREEIDLISSNMIASYAQYGYDTTDPTFLAVMNQQAVEYAVQLKVMEQKGKEMGCDQFTEEEKAQIAAENTAAWNEVVDAYVMYYGGVTAESTEEEIAAARISMLSMLESMGYTEAVMLEDAYENAMFDRVEATMIEGATVTDEEIRALFDQRVAEDQSYYQNDIAMYEYMTQYYGETSYYVPAGYRGVTHILLEVDEELLGNYQAMAAELEEQQEAEETETTGEATATDTVPVTQADVDAARQAIIDSVQPTIDEINAKLAAGTPFADLIVEYGTDPGMDQEPAKSEGYSVHMDSIIWDPVFVQAAFSVDNVGDIAAPVVGSYGVHIVQYTRDVPSGAVEYTADIQLALHEAALGQKENELFNATMEKWMAAAEVSYSAEAQAMIDAGKAVE